MKSQIIKVKIDKYYVLTSKALSIVKNISKGKEKDAKEIINLINRQ